MTESGNRTKVSVIIPAFNVQDSIGRAIKSVQGQTLQDYEIIVVDDCSTDKTIETVTIMMRSDSRIRLFVMEKNSGPSAARNKGFTEARGQWLALLDADDTYKCERLERLIYYGEKHGLDMVADNIIKYDQRAACECGKIVCNSGSDPASIDLRFHLEPPVSYQSRLKSFYKANKRRTFCHPALLKYVLLRSFIVDNGISYPSHFRNGEDFYFYAWCFINKPKAVILPDALYIYTERIGAISKVSSGLSKTPALDSSAAQIPLEIIDKFGALLSKEERRLLLRRSKSSLGAYKYQSFKTKLREKAFFAAFVTLFNPVVWRHCARDLKNCMLR